MCFLKAWINKVLKKVSKEEICTETAEEYERCVLCGAMTETLRSTPIEFREDYEVGCGQLCHSCYKKINTLAEQSEEELSSEQLLFAVAQSQSEDK